MGERLSFRTGTVRMIENDPPRMILHNNIVHQENVRKAIVELEKGLNAARMSGPASFNYRDYSIKHLLTEAEGWEAPAHEVVNAWFEHFKSNFPEYSSDLKLGKLLGLKGNSGNSDRRMRAFRLGERPVPYGIWRRFLVMTGRVSQEIIPVMVIITDVKY